MLAQTLVTLMLRLVAWALVTYGLVSLDVAVMITSDPDVVSLLSALVAAGVVMLTETLDRVMGGTLTRMLMAVLPKFVQRWSDKFVLERPVEKPPEPKP